MGNFVGYCCSLCGKQYLPQEVTYTCPTDGGNLDVVLDIAGIKKLAHPNDIFASREPSLWRYLPLLPVTDPGGIGTPLRAAGWTPIFKPQALARKLGLESLWVKDESRNPTASFRGVGRTGAEYWGGSSGDCLDRQCRGSPGRDGGCGGSKSDHFCPAHSTAG